jgi:hypothetical protein
MVDTDVKYHPGKITRELDKIVLEIPIEKNANDELDSSKVLSNRFKAIRTLLNNIDFTKENKFYQYIFNSLNILKIPIECQLWYSDMNFENFELLNPINVKNEVFETDCGNGCIIRQIINPYISDYGLFANISKPYKEFTSYGYNYLHLYEHMMCSWAFNLSKENVVFVVKKVCFFKVFINIFVL